MNLNQARNTISSFAKFGYSEISDRNLIRALCVVMDHLDISQSSSAQKTAGGCTQILVGMCYNN